MEGVLIMSNNTDKAIRFFTNYAAWEAIESDYREILTTDYTVSLDEDEREVISAEMNIAHIYPESVLTCHFREIEIACNTPEELLTDEQEQLLQVFNKTKFSNYKQHG